MEKIIKKEIKTDDGEFLFQIRIIKDEGVGLLTTREEKNYLILDSADYWYDLIQDGYPRKKRCSCKNDWFKVQFQYTYREHYDEIREVQVITICSQCGKITSTTIDIKYSPTEQLLDIPITYCNKPKIKYKYKDLSAFWNKSDLENFLYFITDNLHYKIYVWYFTQTEQIRVFEEMKVENIPESFLDIYLTKDKLVSSSISDFSDELGIYVREDLWRKYELLDCTYYNISGIGLHYSIKYATQYINSKGEVKNKSKSFDDDTIKLLQWLKENFVTERRRDCFDGKEAYQKYLNK